MPKPKNTNQFSSTTPQAVEFSTEQRIEFLANLIVDRIMDDQRKGQPLLRKITRVRHATADT